MAKPSFILEVKKSKHLGTKLPLIHLASSFQSGSFGSNFMLFAFNRYHDYSCICHKCGSIFYSYLHSIVMASHFCNPEGNIDAAGWAKKLRMYINIGHEVQNLRN